MLQLQTILAHLLSFAVYLAATAHSKWKIITVSVCDTSAESGVYSSPHIAPDGEERSR